MRLTARVVTETRRQTHVAVSRMSPFSPFAGYATADDRPGRVVAFKSKQPSIAKIRRDHTGQLSGRLPVRAVGPLVSSDVYLVPLHDARERADDLWNGAVAPHTHWSVRVGYIEQLHTLCYQILADLAARHVRTVAIEIDDSATDDARLKELRALKVAA